MSRLIDADKLKEHYSWWDDVNDNYKEWKKDFDTIIDLQSTVEAEPKHGRWMPHPEEDEWDVCSVCGVGTKRREHGFDASGEWETEYSYRYCPNCGARMDEVEE